MKDLKVTTNLVGMDELNDSIACAKEALVALDNSVSDIYAAFQKIGLTIEQPPADTEG